VLHSIPSLLGPMSDLHQFLATSAASLLKLGDKTQGVHSGPPVDGLRSFPSPQLSTSCLRAQTGLRAKREALASAFGRAQALRVRVCVGSWSDRSFGPTSVHGTRASASYDRCGSHLRGIGQGFWLAVILYRVFYSLCDCCSQVQPLT